MSSHAADILGDIAAALRTAGGFGAVFLGAAPSQAEVPRTEVIQDGVEILSPDDSASTSWRRLRASVTIHTRAADAAVAAQRTDELSQAVQTALLADPYRSGKCVDLPVGRATELLRSRPVSNLKRPDAAVAIELRCHFEKDES